MLEHVLPYIKVRPLKRKRGEGEDGEDGEGKSKKLHGRKGRKKNKKAESKDTEQNGEEDGTGLEPESIPEDMANTPESQDVNRAEMTFVLQTLHTFEADGRRYIVFSAVGYVLGSF